MTYQEIAQDNSRPFCNVLRVLITRNIGRGMVAKRGPKPGMRKLPKGKEAKGVNISMSAEHRLKVQTQARKDGLTHAEYVRRALDSYDNALEWGKVKKDLTRLVEGTSGAQGSNLSKALDLLNKTANGDVAFDYVVFIERCLLFLGNLSVNDIPIGDGLSIHDAKPWPELAEVIREQLRNGNKEPTILLIHVLTNLLSAEAEESMCLTAPRMFKRRGVLLQTIVSVLPEIENSVPSKTV